MNFNDFIINETTCNLKYYYEAKINSHDPYDENEPPKTWLEYYNSDEYEYHLTYLIETWKNNLIDNFDNLMEEILSDEVYGDDDTHEIAEWKKELMVWKTNYDKTFEYICNCYDGGYCYGYCYTKFNYYWIDDIFESNILCCNLK